MKNMNLSNFYLVYPDILVNFQVSGWNPMHDQERRVLCSFTMVVLGAQNISKIIYVDEDNVIEHQVHR